MEQQQANAIQAQGNSGGGGGGGDTGEPAGVGAANGHGNGNKHANDGAYGFLTRDPSVRGPKPLRRDSSYRSVSMSSLQGQGAEDGDVSPLTSDASDDESFDADENRLSAPSVRSDKAQRRSREHGARSQQPVSQLSALSLGAGPGPDIGASTYAQDHGGVAEEWSEPAPAPAPAPAAATAADHVPDANMLDPNDITRPDFVRARSPYEMGPLGRGTSPALTVMGIGAESGSVLDDNLSRHGPTPSDLYVTRSMLGANDTGQRETTRVPSPYSDAASRKAVETPEPTGPAVVPAISPAFPAEWPLVSRDVNHTEMVDNTTIARKKRRSRLLGGSFGTKTQTAPVLAVPAGSEANPLDEHPDANGSSCELWTPFVLRVTVLFGYVMLLMGYVIGLVFLYYFSRVNDGLLQANIKDRGLWKYGPTALVVLLIALWSQVDYRTKQLTPWYVMCSKRSPATRTVLVDYVSSWNVSALWNAFKNRHAPVLLTIVGMFLLQLTAIVSPGLFELHTKTINTPTPDLKASYRFDPSRFGDFDAGSSNFSHLYGIWAGIQQNNLSHPTGVTSTMAFQTFNLTSLPDGADPLSVTMSGHAEYFAATLHCSTALDQVELNTQSGGTKSGDGVLVTVTSTSALSLNVDTDECRGQFSLLGSTVNGTFVLSYAHSCNGDTATGRSLNATADTWAQDNLVIIALQNDGSDNVKASMVKCTPSVRYGIAMIQAPYAQSSFWPSSPNMTDLTNTTSHAHDVFKVFGQTVVAGVDAADNVAVFLSPGIDEFQADNFFSFLNTSYPQPAGKWLDPETIKMAAVNGYSSLTAIIAKQAYTTPSTESVSGSISTTETRLAVRVLSWAVMGACLFLMVGICSVLMFTAPRAVTPRDPAALGGTIAILAQSPNFLSYFQGRYGPGALDLLRNSGVLIGTSFSERRSKFSIEVSNFLAPGSKEAHYESILLNSPSVGTVKSQQTEEEEDALIPKWWRPWGSTWVSKSTTLVTLVALIAVLEVLYHKANETDGISRVYGPMDWIPYYWAYIPTLVVLVFAGIIGAVDVTIRLMQPFHVLKRGNAPPETSLLDRQFGRIAPLRLWNSAKKLQLAVLATTLTAILAPTTIIAVSGLCETMEGKATSQTTEARILDALDGSRLADNVLSRSFINSTADVWTLALKDELAIPPFTTDVFALPQITMQDSPVQDTAGTVLQINLQAARGRLECERMTDVSSEPADGGSTRWQVTIPSKCTPEGQSAASVSNFTVNKDTYFGRMDDSSGTAMANNTCYGLILGYGLNSQKDKSPTFMGCKPTISRSNVKASFSLPDLTVSRIEDGEGSAHSKTIHPDNWAAFLWTVNGPASSDKSNLPAFADESVSFDNVFSAVLQDLALQPSSLSDSSDSDFDRIKTGLEKAYGRIAARVASAQLRSAPTKSATVDATLMSGKGTILVINAVAVRALQGLYGALLVLLVAAFALSASWRTERLLPCSPASIAGVAGLVAGSRMLSNSKEGGGGGTSLAGSLRHARSRSASNVAAEKRGGYLSVAPAHDGLMMNPSVAGAGLGLGLGLGQGQGHTHMHTHSRSLSQGHSVEGHSRNHSRSASSTLTAAGGMGIVPAGAEWMDDAELARRRVFDVDGGFSLRWWGLHGEKLMSPGGSRSISKRYGVDSEDGSYFLG